MCSINGIFAYGRSARRVCAQELERTRDYMFKRGPDGKGAWTSQNGDVGLASRRLAIIDLSDQALQPMASACGRYVVAFNGEIYNYRDLRTDLEARGRVFRTNSDTETLLHLYALEGAAMVHRLRGMFAFAIWDAKSSSLFLARDPFGVKPLYYADDGATVRFASQVKALIHSGVSRDPDPAGWAGFFMFGSVPAPLTCFKAIRSLPAGAHVTVTPGGMSDIKHYFRPTEVFRDGEVAAAARGSNTGAVERIHGALHESVRYHLVADVPVGAFLSGGVDSTALVGLMRDEAHDEIQTITLSFEDFEGTKVDESDRAEASADAFATRHRTRRVTSGEFATDLPSFFASMDQPTIDGLNTWFVAKAAHEQGLKVAISGLGGDELFGGYSSFSEVPRAVRYLRYAASVPRLGRGVRQLLSGREMSNFGARIGLSPKHSGLLEFGGTYAGAYFLRRGLFMPWELGAEMARIVPGGALADLPDPIALIAERLVPEPASDFAKVSAMECSMYMQNQLLRDTDWASMAHSLEVRVPLVDPVLMRALALDLNTVASTPSKSLLRTSPRSELPTAAEKQPKLGFTLPMDAWLDKLNGKASGGGRREHWSRRWARMVARTYLATVGKDSAESLDVMRELQHV